MAPSYTIYEKGKYCMSEVDELLRVTRQWVQQAANATYTPQMGEDCPTDTVCFHAQQRVEK